MFCIIIIIGKQIEGIWHTSVVVFEKEHYFGMEGVSVCEPVCKFEILIC